MNKITGTITINPESWDNGGVFQVSKNGVIFYCYVSGKNIPNEIRCKLKKGVVIEGKGSVNTPLQIGKLSCSAFHIESIKLVL